MAGYNTFSVFYDALLERLYKSSRRQAADALGLEPGAAVIDLACGTGQNFPFLVERLGEEGRLVGVDLSPGMLGRARRRARNWPQVRLLEMDARELAPRHIAEACGGPVAVDAVLVTLGFTVIPDWQAVFENTFELLRPGGRYVIFDAYADAERRVPQSRVVEFFAQADLGRRVWEPLERASKDFERRILPGSPHVHGGQLVLASGLRPE